MEKKRISRDKVQNLLIVLLAVSAVLLFIQTQVASRGLHLAGEKEYESRRDNLTAGTVELADLAAPVQVAVGVGGSRSGLTSGVTLDEELSGLSTMLGAALGSSADWTVSGDKAFREALENGVYYDFGEELPLPVLAGILGAELVQTEEITARQMVLTPGDGSALLYIRSESGRYSFCTTDIQNTALQKELERFTAHQVFFAFEGGEDFGHLAPYTLLAADMEEKPLLLTGNSLVDGADLLQQLDFNPNTKSRYSEADGTEVIVEGSRSLRLGTDGEVVYQENDDSGTLSIPSASELPTGMEAVLGTQRIAQTALSGLLGEASLYLERVTALEEGWEIRFGFQHNGVPIRFSNGSCGAEFFLKGSAVERFTMHFHRYQAAEEQALVLPLTQAAAVAENWPEIPLALAYVDSGSSVSLNWLGE